MVTVLGACLQPLQLYSPEVPAELISSVTDMFGSTVTPSVTVVAAISVDRRVVLAELVNVLSSATVDSDEIILGCWLEICFDVASLSATLVDSLVMDDVYAIIKWKIKKWLTIEKLIYIWNWI